MSALRQAQDRALAGTIDQRVTLASPDEARDAIGSASGDWIEQETLWAQVVPDGARRWRLTFRLPCPAAIGWRLSWAERTLVAAQVTSDPRRPDRVTIVGEER